MRIFLFISRSKHKDQRSHWTSFEKDAGSLVLLNEDVMASKMMLHVMSRQCRLHHLGVKRPYKQLDNEPSSFAKEKKLNRFKNAVHKSNSESRQE